MLLDKEFDKLLTLPSAERILVEIASSEEPGPTHHPVGTSAQAEPGVAGGGRRQPRLRRGDLRALAGEGDRIPLQRGDRRDLDLLEEVLAHSHTGEGDEDHQHEDIIWTPSNGFTRVAHEHLHLREEQHTEFEATGRFFGLKVKGFPRELVEAADSEVVGYYLGRDIFELEGKEGQAASLDVIRAVPFNSGAHLGTPVAHEGHGRD